MTRRTPTQPLDRILGALAEPNRRQIFEHVLEQPGLSTSELAARSGSITRWGVMKHLDVLRDAGLVQTMATGRRRRHYAEHSALAPLRAWLDETSARKA
jgi:DNA-binding transcriptional ArsR family regulator